MKCKKLKFGAKHKWISYNLPFSFFIFRFINFDFLFFYSIFKIFWTIASSKKNLTEEKIDFEEETGDKVLNDEVELVDEEEDSEDDDGDEDKVEGDEEEDDEEGEEVMDFFSP